MIASGTPAGAISTIQPLDTTPGTVSSMVGRSGTLGRRFVEATPSSLRLPLCVPGARPARPSNMIGMRPAMTSLTRRGAARRVNERHVRLGALAEQFAGQMRLAAAIGGGEQHAARRLVGERDQLRDVVGRDVLVDRDGDRLLADHADRR